MQLRKLKKIKLLRLAHEELGMKAAGMEPYGGCLCIGCLERRIGRNAAEKLRRDHPEQHRRMREHLAKKKSQSGHARG